jgi:hypothetical protein
MVSPTAAVQGWSFALCHWEDKATVTEIATATDLDILRDGDPVHYVVNSIVPGDRRAGVTQAVIVDFSTRSYGPYPQGIDLLYVRYEVFSDTEISFSDCVLGDPPVQNLIVIRGKTYVPGHMPGGRLVSGVLPAHAHFIRGDATRNGEINVGDAIRICVTATGNGPVPCDDAADVDDNGRVDIGDAIALLAYLFAGGRPPASPFPDPGTDLTTWDDLTCEQ